jgi:hypothetical protein
MPKRIPKVPSFAQLAEDAMECAQAWRRYAERPRLSGMLSRNAVKLSALFIHQHVLLTSMAEEEKEAAR